MAKGHFPAAGSHEVVHQSVGKVQVNLSLRLEKTDDMSALFAPSSMQPHSAIHMHPQVPHPQEEGLRVLKAEGDHFEGSPTDMTELFGMVTMDMDAPQDGAMSVDDGAGWLMTPAHSWAWQDGSGHATGHDGNAPPQGPQPDRSPLHQPVSTTAARGALSALNNATDPATDLAMRKKMRALELKRKRNRECMRRARLRKRQERDTIQQTIEDLEKQLAQLRMQKLNDNGHTLSLRDAKDASAGKISCDELQMLADAFRRENAELERVVKHKEALVASVREIAKEMSLMEVDDANAPFRMDPDEGVDEKLFLWVYDVLPVLPRLTAANVQTLVQRSYAKIQKYAALAAQCTPSANKVLGWDDKRFLDGQWVNFMFSKDFHHVTLEEVLNKSWTASTDLNKIRAFQPRTQRMRLVRRLDEDTIVIARSMFLPNDDRDYCTIMLVFRYKTETGYIVGTQTVLPDDPLVRVDPGANYVYVHLCYALIFTYLETGGVRAEFGGRVGNGTELYARLVAMDVLLATLRWENYCVGPLLRLDG
ncbi:TPA: hypothetical protein N0F65_000255 [Lagenidium giganteum]|uniref:BZIP domain-containing protein n=1 Tax=Lagenidium giganteum TaxID=4803 RepID=A0AAV2Z3Q8_9STRA|nr:TPA: hypothetical protein N0F65_000255 [Lagenidium giganteum]